MLNVLFTTIIDPSRAVILGLVRRVKVRPARGLMVYSIILFGHRWVRLTTVRRVGPVLGRVGIRFANLILFRLPMLRMKAGEGPCGCASGPLAFPQIGVARLKWLPRHSVPWAAALTLVPLKTAAIVTRLRVGSVLTNSRVTVLLTLGLALKTTPAGAAT